jgi:outer membrane protein OmpA-like peptidoglycan-associated protein
MKKILPIALVIANALFLPGCWKRTKKNEVNLSQPIKIGNDENTCATSEINFNNNNPEYTINEGKTIFDDNDNNIELSISTDNNDQIKIIEHTNSLNNTILTDESNDLDTMNTIIEQQKIHIETVLFDFDVYEHTKSDNEKALQGAMARVQLALANNPLAHVIIEGHACNSSGSERYNLELSDKRAITIKNKIVASTGIALDRFSVFGCGTSHLIVHGSRYEQGPNRRVEIFILN